MRKLLLAVTVLAFQVFFAWPILNVFAGLRVRRRALLPKGPCLVVANHNSHLDAPILISLFPLLRRPRVHPVAAADYFESNWIRRMFAVLFLNSITIERKARPGQDPLESVIQALRDGESLVFFPEGSRGEPGVVAPFRAGVGHIVRAVPGLLVVPVFLAGPERIWPRGQSIPVPLGIEATVGKPRTYPADAEPREIAAMVREDVLALAPPAPPAPGPRQAPPVHCAVCCVEPALRSAAFRNAMARLGSIAPTVGLGEEAVLDADASGVHDRGRRVPVVRSRAWIGLMAWAFRTGGQFRGLKFAEMVERSRMDEALHAERNVRFVVGEGSALVDLMAWFDVRGGREPLNDKELHQVRAYLEGERRIPFARWGDYARKAPGVWLLNVLDLVRPRRPDVLVLVSVSAEDAMARIRAGGEPVATHETEEFLGRLQESYRRAAGSLRLGGVEVIEIESAEIDRPDAMAAVEAACTRAPAVETTR